MLTLPVKKKWYDMIASGEKTEEYREMKHYWTVRLFKAFRFIPGRTYIRIRNGYSTKDPTLLCLCQLGIGEGKPEWGAEPGVNYYVIKILKKTKEI